MKEGTRVAFRPSPASRALYGYAVPNDGEHGIVSPVSFGGAGRTVLPGPGGGLVYVRWDSGEFCGVSRRDVRTLRPEWRKAE